MTDTITDAKGRVLKLRELRLIDQYRLARAMGADSAIETCRDIAFAVALVAELDGNPVPLPTKLIEVEALVMRIGDDGVAALMREASRRKAEKEADGTAAEDPTPPPVASPNFPA